LAVDPQVVLHIRLIPDRGTMLAYSVSVSCRMACGKGNLALFFTGNFCFYDAVATIQYHNAHGFLQSFGKGYSYGCRIIIPAASILLQLAWKPNNR
jgi:hypothetical protein